MEQRIARTPRQDRNRRRIPSAGRLGLASNDRRWLGVCLTLARRFHLDERLVRLGFVVFGIVTGPIAVLVYIGFYLEMYWSANDAAIPRIEGIRVAKMIAGILAMALALFFLARSMLGLAAWGYETVMQTPLELGQWAWIHGYNNTLLTAVLFLTLPLGFLAAMPLPNRWNHTLKTVTQAILALYAAAVAFGAASIIVGIILQAIEDFFA